MHAPWLVCSADSGREERSVTVVGAVLTFEVYVLESCLANGVLQLGLCARITHFHSPTYHISLFVILQTFSAFFETKLNTYLTLNRERNGVAFNV